MKVFFNDVTRIGMNLKRILDNSCLDMIEIL